MPTTDDLRAIMNVEASATRNHRLKTLGFMHKQHGVGVGSCRTCAHLAAFQINSAIQYVYKCRKFKVSSSKATDWRKGWLACGAKEESPRG